MSGVIDHRPCSYGHGIVSQNCFAKEYSDAGMEIKVVRSGTFVQVHSVRDDDVLFCIVRDDMEVETNQMICKKADILNVPENLWGPLFTIKKKMARLLLVKDSEVAESIGNISVGHTVQVLGPDSSVICIANVAFRNSIGRLGIGVYFGLKVLSSKESLRTIIEKVSLLGPGTKGFPRGCDIVVTIDKILPSNCNFSKKKPNGNRGKECKTELVKDLFSEEDVNGANRKSGAVYNWTVKRANICKKDERDGGSEADDGFSDSPVNKPTCSDNPLHLGDEVVYLRGGVPENGFAKWMSLIDNSVKDEVEFDNSIGRSIAPVDCLGEFSKTKCQNVLNVSPTALIKLSDYLMNNSKEKPYIKKKNSSTSNNNYHNSNSNNNSNGNLKNNNNNNNNNSSSSSSSNSNSSGGGSNNNNNNNNNNYYSNNLNTNNSIGNNNNNTNNNNCGGSSTTGCGNNCSSGNNASNIDHCCRYYEFSYDGKQNIEDGYKKSKKVSALHPYLKHSETNDCSPPINKEDVFDEKDLFRGGNKSDRASELGLQSISRSSDFREPDERKKSNCNSSDNGLMQKETNLHLNAQNPRRAPRLNRSSHDFYDLAGAERERSHHGHFCPGKKSVKPHGGQDDFNFFHSPGLHSAEQSTRNSYEKEMALTGKMTGVLDNPYIPVTVLEQSILAKKASGGASWSAEDPYDVPPSAVRRVPAPAPEASPSLHPRKQDAWSWQREHSSSEESLGECCGPPGPCSPEDLGRGSVVELSFRGEPHFGVIRWIGTLPDEREDSPPRLVAGVEMEEEYPGFTDGTFNNKRYFQCNPKKALFVPLIECRKDSRFLDESQKQSVSPKINYGQIDCPIVEGTIPPINRKGDIESICGKNRGIQGHHNSCYLDATLFSMFAFTSVFDSLLYRPPTKNDIPQYSEVQRVLREEIVNPLRKNLYVRADRVMKLRTLLEKLSSVSGLTSEEKDPEEFLNSLLAQILKAEPFLKLSSGQEAFHYQLFVEKDERLILPSVQQLFEQSFLASDIKLKQVPSCLIIQMPRFGKSFKMYSRILPPHLLDITDIIENSPRQCTVCGKLAEFECKDCFGQQGIGNGLESISFCKTCLDTVHNHHCRSRHNSRALTVPVEFYELQEHCIIPRLYMELFAVVCIETSHYVAFVKCGSGSDAPWCFFDSMADRKGEQNGYNIPEMVPCPDLPFWLSEDGAKMLNEMRDERQLTEHAKRLFSDAYMCMYQSPDLMMYR